MVSCRLCLYGGAVAQLGERQVRNLEVVGSTPIGSTNSTSGGVAFRIPVSGQFTEPAAPGDR